MRPLPTVWRAILAAALLALPALPASHAAAQPRADEVLVISRERVLEEAAVARQLNEAEARLTDQLQTRVDAVKAELNAEEQELVRLRGTLPRAEFDRRVQSFDQRVRRERRLTQRRAARLQTAFRQARSEIVEALVPILVAISRERGARLVLDRDQILVAHPSIDVTDEVISRMDATVRMPRLPTLEELEPPPGDPDAAEEQGAAPAPAPGDDADSE